MADQQPTNNQTPTPKGDYGEDFFEAAAASPSSPQIGEGNMTDTGNTQDPAMKMRLSDKEKLAAIQWYFSLQLFPPHPDHPDWVQGVLVRVTHTSHGDIQEPPATDSQLVHVWGDYKDKYYRILFALYYGRLPQGMVDHRDGDTSNNRLENLRDATAQQNAMNRGKVRRRTGVDLPRGVTAILRRDGSTEYRARGFVKGENGTRRYVHLGCFITVPEAFWAAEEFRKEHHAEFYRDHSKFLSDSGTED